MSRTSFETSISNNFSCLLCSGDFRTGYKNGNIGTLIMDSYIFPDAEVKNFTEKLSPLLNRLLLAKGINNEKEASQFLNPDYDLHLHPPELLNDIDVACERIEKAISKKEQIAIFSDYDSDGIPGAVILHDFFKVIEHKNFQNYIPHRHYEGFGLSNEAIDKLQKDKVKLIITIDCGTSNVDEVAYAKSLGIDVIVTDHHEPAEKLPDAVAIVNPKLGEYPFPDLCGAATVFKLVQALIAREKYDMTLGWEKWWLDMVGVATVADMVPLVGENRVFAYYGLQVLRKSRRPGLQQLLRKVRLNQRYLNEDDIGFIIGPRINAASRMDSPEEAFLMLSETDEVKAGEKVEHLEKLNLSRKTQVALITKDLHKRIKKLATLPAVLVMGSPDWRPSLVGLAAGKLAEEFNRPTFLWGADGNGIYKGSCRSGGGVSVVKLMQAVPEVFIEHGGHHVAGGFSVKEDEIFTFGEKLNEVMNNLDDVIEDKSSIKIDAELGLEEVNQLLVEQLKELSPYGTGNEKPLFVFKNVVPHSVELFGKTKEHSKLIFQTERGKLEAIAFFSTPSQFSMTPTPDVPCTLIAHVEESYFMNRRQIRIRLIDVIGV